MSAVISISSGRSYGVSRVCRTWAIARSSFYAWRKRNDPSEAEPRRAPRKRGPKTEVSDEQVLVAIREILEEVEEELGFRGEGHRKVHARLRHRGVPCGRDRTLRLMRENGLLAPCRATAPRRTEHDGTITTETPNEMWGTDGTCTWTREDGNVTVFVAVDHCVGDCVGIHAAKIGDRFEALEPIHQGIRAHYGELERGVAEGLEIRHDCASQYMSQDFQNEAEFLGFVSSPTFVRSPQSNGIAERFIKTLKQQLLWIKTFDTVEDLRKGLLDFQRRFNQSWLYERHGHRTPDQVRREFEHAA